MILLFEFLSWSGLTARFAVTFYKTQRRQNKNRTFSAVMHTNYKVQHVFRRTNSSAYPITFKPKLTPHYLSRTSSCSSPSGKDCAPNSALCLIWNMFDFALLSSWLSFWVLEWLMHLACVFWYGELKWWNVAWFSSCFCKRADTNNAAVEEEIWMSKMEKGTSNRRKNVQTM